MARKAVQRLIPIQADSTGNLPGAIHLLSVGHWHTPWHGAFEHTSQDLAEMVEHFDGSIGLLLNKETNKPEAPVNYGHERGGKASGWITELYLDNDGTELWGKTTWTAEGQRALKEGEYKYISPEWHPRDFPWEDPEEEGAFVENVFIGAALTNIPLFKKLSPVMASADTGGGGKAKQPEGGDMDLEEVRKKKLDELNDEEKTFLEEHKADLTDDERTAFGLAEADEDDTKEEGETQEGGTKAVEGSAKTAVISDEELNQLRADAQAGREAQRKLLEADMRAEVKKHVERGAIKSGETDSTVEMLMASSEKQREAQIDFIKKLPDNKMLAKESGSSAVEASQVEITDADLELAEAFGNTKEEIEEYKKAKAA